MKKLLAILLVVATLFCIVACGDNTDETTTTTTQDSTTTTLAQNDDTSTTTVADDTTTTTVEDTTTTTVAETTTKKPVTTTKNPYVPTPIGGVDPTDSNNYKKVVNDVFTSDRGGLQMKAEGWKTYGLYSISMVPVDYANVGSTNAICVSVYDPDSEDVFANKTITDFETVLGVSVDSLTKTTVRGYPAYKAVSEGVFYVWVINTPNCKYFINFMQVDGMADMHEIGKQMMATIEIFK